MQLSGVRPSVCLFGCVTVCPSVRLSTLPLLAAAAGLLLWARRPRYRPITARPADSSSRSAARGAAANAGNATLSADVRS